MEDTYHRREMCTRPLAVATNRRLRRFVTKKSGLSRMQARYLDLMASNELNNVNEACRSDCDSADRFHEVQ